MQQILKAAVLATLFTACTQPAMHSLPPIPDAAYAKGVSAPFCGLLSGNLVVAGGANFPDKPLLEGGAKRVYDDIWQLKGAEWKHLGHLPDSTAYGATFGTPDGLVLAGGNVCGSTTDKVYLLKSDGTLISLPPLPVPVEQAAPAQADGFLYLVGGNNVFRCREGEWEWSRLATLPMPLTQPVAFVHSDALYLWGGFNAQTLEVPADGWKLSLQDPAQGWKAAPGIPDGGTFVGSAGTVLPDGRLAVVGGVNRDIFARALHNTPEDRIPYLSKEPWEYHFRSAVYAFDPIAEAWSLLADDPACALAGPGLCASGHSLYVAGGELKPGVRSPRIFTLAW